jgi:hypothetical protein
MFSIFLKSKPIILSLLQKNLLKRHQRIKKYFSVLISEICGENKPQNVMFSIFLKSKPIILSLLQKNLLKRYQRIKKYFRC